MTEPDPHLRCDKAIDVLTKKITDLDAEVVVGLRTIATLRGQQAQILGLLTGAQAFATDMNLASALDDLVERVKGICEVE